MQVIGQDYLRYESSWLIKARYPISEADKETFHQPAANLNILSPFPSPLPFAFPSPIRTHPPP